MLTVDESGLHLFVIIGACMGQTLQNTLVSILQVIFSYQTNVYDFCCLLAPFQKIAPRSQLWCRSDFHAHLTQNDSIQSLTLHVDRYLIDAWHILTLDDGRQINITEMGNLRTKVVTQLMLRP